MKVPANSHRPALLVQKVTTLICSCSVVSGLVFIDHRSTLVLPHLETSHASGVGTSWNQAAGRLNLSPSPTLTRLPRLSRLTRLFPTHGL